MVTDDIQSNRADVKWYNVQANGTVGDLFASATLLYGDPFEWLSSWVPMAHLVQSRIQDLERLAESGIANRFTHNMAYLLFANNLVDYATKYRGMHSVVLLGLEAFADVVLSMEKGGSWTVPPYFIDSLAHLAGFVMNVSDSIDTKNNFCVTPGWRSMRFAKPLVAGARYRSYVKMIPTAEDPSVYLGDVYILQDDVIIGTVGGIQFRRYPRILLSRFFSASDDPKTLSKPALVESSAPPQNGPKPISPPAPELAPAPAMTPVPASAPKAAVNVVEACDTTSAKAIQIIATEAGLNLADLVDDATFGGLGVDSLMSLVIAEKFREQLGVTVAGSLFVEFPTIRDLRSWLEEYYS